MAETYEDSVSVMQNVEETQEVIQIIDSLKHQKVKRDDSIQKVIDKQLINKPRQKKYRESTFPGGVLMQSTFGIDENSQEFKIQDEMMQSFFMMMTRRQAQQDKDLTIPISDEHIQQIEQEITSQKVKNFTKKLDQQILNEQRVKNINKVLDSINQKGVTNYNSIQVVPSSEIMTMMQNKLLESFKQSQDPSWNGRCQSNLSQTSIELPSIFDNLIHEMYAPNTIEAKQMKELTSILCKLSYQRTQKELQLLSKFFLQFAFFENLQYNHGTDTLLKVMSFVYIQRAEKGAYLIDEGAEGDRFYVNLKGVLGVDKAMEQPVQGYLNDMPFKTYIWLYLQSLFDNLEKVYWPRVPYALAIKKYMYELQQQSQKSPEQHDVIQEFGESSLDNQTFQQKIVNRVLSQPNCLERQIFSREESPLASTNQNVSSLMDSKMQSQDQMSKEQPFTPFFSLQLAGVKIPELLYNNLERLDTIFDFSVFYLNKQVAQIPSGRQFGELAHVLGQKRQASIFAKEQTFLAFVEQKDYVRVLKVATIQDMKKKLNILKTNRFFDKITSTKLQKIQYNAKRLIIQKNQQIYKENDEVDGLYLVISGSLLYKKKIQVELPVDSTTQNKWFKDEIKFQGFNKRFKSKDIAIFEQNEMIGQEEILRQHILKQQQSDDNEKDSKIVIYRDFSCIGKSQVSEVLFFSKEIIMPIIKLHDMKFIQKVFQERRIILNTALNALENVKNEITGSEIAIDIQEITNKNKITEEYNNLKKATARPVAKVIDPPKLIKFDEAPGYKRDYFTDNRGSINIMQSNESDDNLNETKNLYNSQTSLQTLNQLFDKDNSFMARSSLPDITTNRINQSQVLPSQGGVSSRYSPPPFAQTASFEKHFITPNLQRSSLPDLNLSVQEHSRLSEKDSSLLYLKDLKTFLGLKRVANKNQAIKNSQITVDKKQLKMQNQFGKKTLYQGVSKAEETEFNLRMVNVYQQLDFFENKKNTGKSYKKQFDFNMNSNDQIFGQMEMQEIKKKYYHPQKVLPKKKLIKESSPIKVQEQSKDKLIPITNMTSKKAIQVVPSAFHSEDTSKLSSPAILRHPKISDIIDYSIIQPQQENEKGSGPSPSIRQSSQISKDILFRQSPMVDLDYSTFQNGGDSYQSQKVINENSQQSASRDKINIVLPIDRSDLFIEGNNSPFHITSYKKQEKVNTNIKRSNRVLQPLQAIIEVQQSMNLKHIHRRNQSYNNSYVQKLTLSSIKTIKNQLRPSKIQPRKELLTKIESNIASNYSIGPNISSIHLQLQDRSFNKRLSAQFSSGASEIKSQFNLSSNKGFVPTTGRINSRHPSEEVEALTRIVSQVSQIIN